MVLSIINKNLSRGLACHLDLLTKLKQKAYSYPLLAMILSSCGSNSSSPADTADTTTTDDTSTVPVTSNSVVVVAEMENLGLVGVNDTITATSSTLTSGTSIVDTDPYDNDTLTITADDDIIGTPTVSGIEKIIFSTSATKLGNDYEFNVNLVNITGSDTVTFENTNSNSNGNSTSASSSSTTSGSTDHSSTSEGSKEGAHTYSMLLRTELLGMDSTLGRSTPRSSSNSNGAGSKSGGGGTGSSGGAGGSATSSTNGSGSGSDGSGSAARITARGTALTTMFKYQTLRRSFDRDIDKPSLSPVGTASARMLASPRKAKRKIPKVPFKVLDAPALQDDFYLNLVDWSSQNILAVGLGSCVYLWSACTSKVTKVSFFLLPIFSLFYFFSFFSF